MTDVVGAHSDGAHARFTPRYKAYVVAVLFLVYVFNFMDRTILSVLLPMIKGELGLADWQLGMLSGTAFALFYATFGVFAARFVDSGNRVTILTVAASVWSLATAACGMAAGFWQLLAARAGVGAGEAVNSPCAASMISDMYPPKVRASALGIWNSGVSVGSAAGLLAGSIIAAHYGWRAAFIAVGVPGIIVALLLRFTVTEPPRGMADNRITKGERQRLFTVARHLFSKPAYRHYVIGSALSATVSGSHIFWLPSFLSRSFGIGLATIGAVLAVTTIFAGLVGTVLGGIMADRMSRKGTRWRMKLPALAMFASIPFSLIGYTSTSLILTLVMLAIAKAAPHTITGPGTSMSQELAGPRMRGTAEAISLFVVLVIAGGLGPLVIGGASDLLNAQFGDESLRIALLGTVFISVWSAFHFLMASRHIERDLEPGHELPVGSLVS